MRIAVSRSVLIGIRRISADVAPREACGLLFGYGDAIAGFAAVENVAETPETRFELDPVALFAALRTERAGGRVVSGYWHSHPNGDAMPSTTDAALAAADGKLWVIVAGETVTCWRAGGEGVFGKFAAVEMVEVAD